MGVIWTLAKREVSGFFFSPIAYMVMFLFLVFLGILFGNFVFVPGQVTDMRSMFQWSRAALFIVVPLMTMAMFSDEYRSGRIEMLRTSPITELQLLLGKYFGAMTFYALLVGTTLLYLALLAMYGRPDYGAVFTAYLGMLLLGMLYVAIGLFFSCCTQNQLVAALSSMIVLAVLTFIDYFTPRFPAKLTLGGMNIPLRQAGDYLGVGAHVEDFSKGIFYPSHLAYFLAGTLFFLFLNYLVLESRKWR